MKRWSRDLATAVVARIRPRRGKRIVVLHDVSDRHRLRDVLAWLAGAYEIVTLPALLGETPETRPQVALTFDDGYRSWYEIAAPVLEELAIPAVFFVCSGFVGLRDDAAKTFCLQRLRRRKWFLPLDVMQVRELAAHPLFEIGSHTVHHVDLGAADAGHTLESEIGGDRRQLEDWTGKPVRWFAFPFGQPENTSAAAQAYLRDQGFSGAFTLVPSFAEGTDRFAIGRDSLDPGAPIWAWRGRLAGGYDGIYRLKRLFNAH